MVEVINETKGRRDGRSRVCTVCGCDHYGGCVNLICPIGYHNSKSENPGEIEIGTPDPLVEREEMFLIVGRVRALMEMAKSFRARAGSSFAAGNDEEAESLREEAVRCERQAAPLQKTLQDKFHYTEPPP